MKPLDSSDGAAGVGGFDVERGAAVRSLATGADLGGQDPDSVEPGSEEPGVGSEPPAAPAHRVSQVVPRGTADDEELSEDVASRPYRPYSDVAPLAELGEPEPDVGAAEAALANGTSEPEPDAGSMEGDDADAPDAGWPEAGVLDAPAAAEAPTPEPRDIPAAPRYAMRELRAALRGDELGMTLTGPAFGPDEDEEATMVDAAAALSEADRMLMARAPSNMAETQLVGTPFPAQARPVAPVHAPLPDGRHPFKQTMLLGLPRLEPPASAAAAPTPVPQSTAPASSLAAQDAPASGAAVLASLVRVVGPPTQPPPRRVRRGSAETTAGGVSPSEGVDLDHEAFVLTNPIGDSARRSSVPAAPPSAPRSSGSSPAASLSHLLPPQSVRPRVEAGSPAVSVPSAVSVPPAVSLPAAVSLPPSSAPAAPAVSAPRASEPPAASAPSVGSNSVRSLGISAASVGSNSVRSLGASAASVGSNSVRALGISAASVGSNNVRSLAGRVGEPSQRASYPPPLRATIEPPTALARTRPPMSRGTVPPAGPLMDELPATDPFAGFVAPAPSAAQRWLVVVVVALAVVGLCSLAAIAFGLLGKTGW